jgi:hypothetical protein
MSLGTLAAPAAPLGLLVFATTLNLAAVDAALVARLKPETVTAWNTYVAAVETRRTTERKDPRRFLVADFQPTAAAERQDVLAGALVVRRMDGARSGANHVDVPSGRVHHWRGAVFIPGPSAAELIDRIEASDPPAIQDDVIRSSVLKRRPGNVHVFLRLQRTKIVTAVYNSEHDVRFETIGPARAASTSVSTKIAEVKSPGTSSEMELPPGDDRGFLWRLNGYWRYESAPGGVIAECESLSLSRDVPVLVDYIVGRVIDGTARESMERTLTALRTRYTTN